ncbi:hypothetical protein [Streptomyces sp. H39-S7]|uniref:hypothetical protein n=1 Tax=Streptomyces sp. H39-S7 TaxID=3004357 RepID=UPI0022AF5D9B|nr:hypothetical protein [Streptomyces sp. H39-S7]MCZ4117798.1 hypothetical protein [Streptomyces sp. H39-S7]
MTAAPAERVYPLVPDDDDPRFTAGLLLDVVKVLEAHGYPPVTTGPDLIDLHVGLFRFLYRGGAA